MKKTVLFILAALMCLSLIACGGNQSGTIETTVKEVTPEGNLILEADIDDLEGEAIIPGNEVLVEVGTYKALVLFNKDILEGQGIDQMYANIDEETVSIFTYEGNFAETNGIKAGDTVKLTKIIQPAA